MRLDSERIDQGVIRDMDVSLDLPVLAHPIGTEYSCLIFKQHLSLIYRSVFKR